MGEISSITSRMLSSKKRANDSLCTSTRSSVGKLFKSVVGIRKVLFATGYSLRTGLIGTGVTQIGEHPEDGWSFKSNLPACRVRRGGQGCWDGPQYLTLLRSTQRNQEGTINTPLKRMRFNTNTIYHLAGSLVKPAH